MLNKKFLAILLAIGLLNIDLIFFKQKLALAVTKIHTFQPEITTTALRKGFCWIKSSSTTREDAWRCMVTNKIYDPCFVTAEPALLLCNVDPLKGSGEFLLKLVEPLPKISLGKQSLSNAWFIKLTDGTICRPHTGLMPIIHKGEQIMPLLYECQEATTGEKSGLVANSIAMGQTWYAQKVVYTANLKFSKSTRVIIAEVWR